MCPFAKFFLSLLFDTTHTLYTTQFLLLTTLFFREIIRVHKLYLQEMKNYSFFFKNQIVMRSDFPTRNKDFF